MSQLTKNQAALLRRVYKEQKDNHSAVSIAFLMADAARFPGQSRGTIKALVDKGLLAEHRVEWQNRSYVALTLAGRTALGLPLQVTAYDVRELCGPCPNKGKDLPTLQAHRDGDFLVVRIPFQVPAANQDDHATEAQ